MNFSKEVQCFVQCTFFKSQLFHATELLERVLFRLGTTENDEQLETAVNTFLTPVLLKITSSNESVRCKVFAFICLHSICK